MIGTTVAIVSELLCEVVDLRSGQKVLDVATGTGNTALAAEVVSYLLSNVRQHNPSLASGLVNFGPPRVWDGVL